MMNWDEMGPYDGRTPKGFNIITIVIILESIEHGGVNYWQRIRCPRTNPCLLSLHVPDGFMQSSRTPRVHQEPSSDSNPGHQ